MDKPIENYWNLRLEAVKEALEKNNFEVHLAETPEDAKAIVMDTIIPQAKPKSLSWGGSMTAVAAGLYQPLLSLPGITAIDSMAKDIPVEEMIERRRQSLLVDLFITGTNAITESGMLVNLDMIGNRVGAIAFGPKNVVICVGRNKIVQDLDDAMYRIKDYAAPVNSMRLDKKTPCVETSICHDCKSPDRICNVWTITEKSFPKGRIKVVIVNQDMGF